MGLELARAGDGTDEEGNWEQATQHDAQGAERRLFDEFVRGELIDLGRQGFEIEGTQNQGGGQFLHTIHEDDHPSG